MDHDEAPLLASATAPAKLILLGEHAVVYGRPALAVPIHALEVRAEVRPSTTPLVIRSRFPNGDAAEERVVDLATAPASDPLAAAARSALERAGRHDLPEWLIEVSSTIPESRGLGSSAAVAVALVRAVGRACDAAFGTRTEAELAFQAERCTHGTPSGIDNTVCAWARPLRFAAGEGTLLTIATPLTLVVADTGQRAATREIVAGVGARRQRRPTVYEDWFDRIGRLIDDATRALASGELVRLGWILNSNHLILQALRVSTPQLDRLVSTARRSGALGAKLSGAGGGGVVVALVKPALADGVVAALQGAGATQVIVTTIDATA